MMDENQSVVHAFGVERGQNSPPPKNKNETVFLPLLQIKIRVMNRRKGINFPFFENKKPLLALPNRQVPSPTGGDPSTQPPPYGFSSLGVFVSPLCPPPVGATDPTPCHTKPPEPDPAPLPSQAGPEKIMEKRPKMTPPPQT